MCAKIPAQIPIDPSGVIVGPNVVKSDPIFSGSRRSDFEYHGRRQRGAAAGGAAMAAARLKFRSRRRGRRGRRGGGAGGGAEAAKTFLDRPTAPRKPSARRWR
jgi:hypothetical protein